MKITAESFNKQPALAYHKAEKGEEVIINHNRYLGVVFVLVARDRGTEFNKEDLRSDERN